MRLDVHRGELAAVIDFDVERDAVAFVEARHAGALHRADVDKGIGLSIVSRLCDRFGWKIELDSELGRGTTATIRFVP